MVLNCAVVFKGLCDLEEGFSWAHGSVYTGVWEASSGPHEGLPMSVRSLQSALHLEGLKKKKNQFHSDLLAP